jgi:capsular polysaccharide transport system permease protein
MDGSDDSHENRKSAAARLGLEAAPTHDFATRLKHWARERRGPLIFVALPTLVVAIYFFLIAADLYASEASFIVRSPSHMPTIGLAGLLQTAGISRSSDDAFAVHDFILSRDAVADLEKKMDLRAMFHRPEGDALAVYPGMFYRNTAEDFYKYYQRMVEIDIDSTTGISTLTVKAFRADDAKQIADGLLAASEDLVNSLNQRAHDEAVKAADTDVRLAEERVAQTQQNMLDYRNREVLLDPTKSSGSILETVGKMEAELAATRTRIAELDRTSPGSPLRADLESHALAVAKQVESERERLAGGGGSMAPKISEYERLMLQQEFAAKELTSAMASLETAREEARRQQFFLDRVVEANLPDKALYPKRIKSVLIVLISCFLAYSIGRLLIAGVLEHAQDG